jgi:HPt (histidine-containing phosphotransfer) domain-containing protein
MTAALEALKLRFLERCSSDLDVLLPLLRAPEAVPRADLKTLVHQMAGAAGAFGFPHLSTLAKQLDDQLSAGEPLSREPVEALIDELRRMQGRDIG